MTLNDVAIKGFYVFWFVLLNVVGGLVLLSGWDWFITPLGVPTISLWQTLGIATIITCFFHSSTGESSEKGVKYDLIFAFTKYLVAYVSMFLYQWLMSIYG